MHVCCPKRIPAAPSHVSALMSGVMIKTGVYGILRVTAQIADLPTHRTAGRSCSSQASSRDSGA